MFTYRSLFLTLLLVVSTSVSLQAAPAKPLFDGKTFADWEGDTNKWWRLEDQAIVGGSLKERVPHNDFLATTEQFTNFVFRTKFKLIGTDGFINSGIQIRSQRVPNDHEMIGYQCDIGDPSWWGSIYDESRRNRVLAQSDINSINKVLKRGDWNEYVIRAEGRRVRTYINGVLGVDYTEPDTSLPQWGRIGFQVHGGGAAEAWFKDITIEILPPTKESPLSPEDQQASFELPEGFSIELVAAEPELPKPVTVTWDDAGRLWAITATEYPLDANENPAMAEALFEKGGRDKILIFDQPEAPGPHKPRVFAEGLAMPLGVLPYKDGAVVQYGREILFLRDSDQDGRADQRETILSGFGIQDSHLFPHQFTRAPGGWIYMAQGAFNYSKVKTTQGVEIQYDQTKLARFRPDGSAFEVLTFGPCNIWGLVINRFGEMFIQEANDYGYPVIPYQPGMNIPGCGDRTFRPYAPRIPAQTDFRMGGTSLSGLALSEDPSSMPKEWREVMFVANPVTRSVQSIRIHRGYAPAPTAKPGETILPNGHHLERLPDLVSSLDEWFRPVAIHFGPDGCLYIVDWYNKIISHNEVPRNHPDRDKTRGRIWRVRHESHKPKPVPDVTKATNQELTKHLQSLNTWEWRAALNQIELRQPRELIKSLRFVAENPAYMRGSLDFQNALRIRTMWALENLQAVDTPFLEKMAQANNRNVRREAIRMAGERLTREDAIQLASRLASDKDHQVRTEVIRTLSGQVSPWHHLVQKGQDKVKKSKLTEQAIHTLVSMAHEPLPNAASYGPGYERAFERYLIRAGLENDPSAVEAWLRSPQAQKVAMVNRRLACLVLPPEKAAFQLATLLKQGSYTPSSEEWLLLHRHRKNQEIGTALSQRFPDYPHHQLLAAVRAHPGSIQRKQDEAWMTESVMELLKKSPISPAEQKLALEVAETFRLSGSEPALVHRLETSTLDPDQELALLKTLTAFKSEAAVIFHGIASDPSKPMVIRQQALHALGASRHPKAAEHLLMLWPSLPSSERTSILHKLSAHKEGTRKILAAFEKELLVPEDIPVPVLENMHALLADDPVMDSLWETVSANLKKVLSLGGGRDDFVQTEIDLRGSFTVETWIKLASGMGNEDGILGRPGSADLNFYNGTFRFFGGPDLGDLAVAQRPMTPDAWTHLAVTREADNRIRIYINGEMDTIGTKAVPRDFLKLDVGRTTPSNKGTKAELTEFRVWEKARTAEEIRESFDRGYAGSHLPEGLAHHFPGEGPWGGPFRGGARVSAVLSAPPLLTEEEVRAVQAMMEKYGRLADMTGKAMAGKELFTLLCQNCHEVNNEGSNLAPPLDGVGHRATDGLLRAILTPSAAMEGGYRSFQVLTRDDELYEGYLVSQDAGGVHLRLPNTGDLHIPLGEIRRAGYRDVSIMPEGLLEGLTDGQVTDLFSYLKSLR